jgi:uncharacterized membrane protein YdjX (TVP38/TMEM64 family)
MTTMGRTAGRAREYVWLALLAAALIAALVLMRAHAKDIVQLINQHPFWGLSLYVILNVFDAVMAPGATLPLIPVAARVWGRVPAALITTAGWTLGSLIAFLIARRWGYPIVKKLTSRRRIRELARYVPSDLFWSIALLRLVMPMDALSYVVGLLTEMSWQRYMLATALGLTPSAFVLTYVGRLRHAYEIMMFGVGVVVVVVATLIARRRSGSLSHR